MDLTHGHLPHADSGLDASAAAAEARQAAAAAATVHKRTYQACLPCRRRKVRCDLGSVDEPGDPPCLRCRREKKDCIFSETRRKRKADEDGGDLDPDFVARNKRSSIGLTAPGSGSGSGSGDAYGDNALGGIHVDEGDIHAMSTLSGDHDDDDDNGTDEDTHHRPTAAGKNRDVANETAAALFRQPITQPGDALRMLVDAASHTENEGRKDSLQQAATAMTASGVGAGAAGRPRTASASQRSGRHSGGIDAAPIDPQLMALEATAPDAAAAAGPQARPGYDEALQAWTTLRFVQAGWFTAREALGYIDYWYEHFASLTPISLPDFRDYSTHIKLLAEEPMLTVTLLTIVSRYMKLQGPGGDSRTVRIHDKLWEYLQGMITRMFWGQEQFGGGFCGAGSNKVVGDPEVRKRGLRSLGTVESLLLLSDWHPRSMHFPPGDDANELTVPLPGALDAELFDEPLNSHAGWTEPAVRSDRMVWSLVGMAYTLSWELGVFDSLVESGRWSPGPQEKTSYDSERADRVGRMLLVYVSQACGRLGYPNMMPNQGNETNFNFLKMDVPLGAFPGPYPIITAEDRMQRAWAELTALMRQSNTEMFESKRRTHESIQNGEYVQFLEAWGPRLREWKARFDQTAMAAKPRTILLIEYEYTRTYIHSLALQAVVESCTTGADDATPAAAHAVHTPPALLSSKFVDIHKRNRGYIDELVEAARSLLRLAVTELLPTGALKHSPVRTHYRILSAAMFLLKSFALGAKESEVQTSMALLDRTVLGLRKSVIDDVHLSLRIAELLNGLTTTIRRKFVRLAVPSRGGKPRGAARTASTSAPKANASNPSTDRATASSGGRAYRPSSSSSTAAAQHGAGANGTTIFSPSSSSFPLQAGDDFYSMLGQDLAPTLVDLKDASITIMPPPDFMGQFATDIYAPLSPHSSVGNAPAGGGGGASSGEHPSPSPTAGNTPLLPGRKPGIQRTNSLGQAQQPPFSPGGGTSAAGTVPPFSPLSTTSGGYDWLALDFNGLLQQGGLHYNQNSGHSPHHTHHPAPSGVGGFGGNGKHEATGPAAPAAGAGDGTGADGDGLDDAADASRDGPWTSGAFGPEISEGLEMLGALGALGFDENGLGGMSYGAGL